MIAQFVDRVIGEIDCGLRTVFAVTPASRPLPDSAHQSATPANAHAEMTPSQREESIRLMRVNHAGEVCAQALYQGQAFVSRSPKTRQLLERSANEERDHLAWCQRRVTELGGRTSVFTPALYAASFAIGALSGSLGDKWSMGFLTETERQVEAHLDGHLQRLPADDEQSRKILSAMRDDEMRHAQQGMDHGGIPLPSPVRGLMRRVSKLMTTSTYWA